MSLTVYDSAALETQTEREKLAANKLYGLLPDEQGRDLLELWLEFEAGQTAEARFAKALDRLLPLLQNYFSGGKTWKANGTRKEQVMKRNGCIGDSSSLLAQYASDLIDDAVARGFLIGD